MVSNSTGTRRASRWRRVAAHTFMAVCAMTCVVSALGLLGRNSVYFFYLDQPRVHYLVILLVCFVVALLLKRWKLGAGIGVFVALNAFVLNSVISLPTSFSDEPHVTVIHANLGKQKEVPSEFLEFVLGQQPDLLCLQEVTPELARQLPEVFPQYRLLDSDPRSDSRGVAVLANSSSSGGIQILSSRVLHLAREQTERPHVEVLVSEGDTRIRILSFHCSRPRNPKTAAIQRAEYDELATWFRASPPGHALAIGDFNASPWSGTVRRFLSEADLPTKQSGFGFSGTWPAGVLGPIGVPIDLAVHSAGLRVETETGPDIGSDHYPILSRVFVVALDDTQ